MTFTRYLATWWRWCMKDLGIRICYNSPKKLDGFIVFFLKGSLYINWVGGKTLPDWRSRVRKWRNNFFKQKPGGNHHFHPSIQNLGKLAYNFPKPELFPGGGDLPVGCGCYKILAISNRIHRSKVYPYSSQWKETFCRFFSCKVFPGNLWPTECLTHLGNSLAKLYKL